MDCRPRAFDVVLAQEPGREGPGRPAANQCAIPGAGCETFATPSITRSSHGGNHGAGAGAPRKPPPLARGRRSPREQHHDHHRRQRHHADLALQDRRHQPALLVRRQLADLLV